MLEGEEERPQRRVDCLTSVGEAVAVVEKEAVLAVVSSSTSTGNNPKWRTLCGCRGEVLG